MAPSNELLSGVSRNAFTERREGGRGTRRGPRLRSDSALQAGESVPAACPVSEAGFQAGSVVGPAAPTCPAFLPGIIRRAFREPARFPAHAPAPRSPGNRCRLRQAPRLDQVNPLQELYILQKKKTPQPSWSSGIQPVARCMRLPGLTSGCSLENRSLPSNAGSCGFFFFREGSHTLGGLKCAVLSKN